MKRFLIKRIRAVADRRPPDVMIGSEANPYLKRWHILPRNRWFNVYLHHFLRSDDDRALHDHPWWNFSLLLEGSYVEHTIAAGGVHVRTLRKAGDWKFRGASAAHRIELLDALSGGLQPCWTLFVTGPKFRSWGFHCPKGWVHWRIFTSEVHGPDGKRVSGIGRGCGEN